MTGNPYKPALVRTIPGGHEFICEPHSNLLEAGLRSGLALEYGCSNGNCGKCLARVVSGEVREIQHHDYRIDSEKEASGHMLMCCNTALTDVVLEAHEAGGASEIPHQHISAKVKNISFVNDNVALVHLKTPRTRRLRFLAGQHVQLGGNGLPVATYSIGSCPCDDMNLHFQIPMSIDNEFSGHVFNALKRGDVVEIDGPGGDFVLAEDSPRALVFVAWRTGFAPIRSLVEHAMALEVAESIRLIWFANDKQDRYLDNLCRSWADALDDFMYVPIDADATDQGIDINQVISDKLGIVPEDLVGFDFYIAGDKSLMRECRKALLNNGLPSNQMTFDNVAHC